MYIYIYEYDHKSSLCNDDEIIRFPITGTFFLFLVADKSNLRKENSIR